MTVTVACVLRSGRTYTPRYVDALTRGVEQHLGDFEFRVLSDRDLGARTIPLKYGWPGWWSKLELLRPDIFSGPVLYFDLDTFIVGDLTALASYRGPWAMLSNLWHPEWAQSGVLAWTPGPVTEAIWKTFSAQPERMMREFPGDGQFLHAHSQPERLQNLFPDQIVSYKIHARRAIPPNARVVCFHAKPKPHTASGWAGQMWRRLGRSV